ncbi:MAG: hypothetical protein H6943_01980 [Zoogloeaceae bacterium]|nr:hypothetical protein [Zoogloeaceae bacterium]
MSPFRQFKAIRCVTVFVALITLSASALPDENYAEGWTDALFRASVDYCREDMQAKLIKDYLDRHQLSTEQLPDDFKTTFAPVVAPYLKMCDCIYQSVAREVPYSAFYNPSSSLAKERTRQLVAPGGLCEVKSGD